MSQTKGDVIDTKTNLNMDSMYSARQLVKELGSLYPMSYVLLMYSDNMTKEVLQRAPMEWLQSVYMTPDKLSQLDAKALGELVHTASSRYRPVTSSPF